MADSALSRRTFFQNAAAAAAATAIASPVATAAAAQAPAALPFDMEFVTPERALFKLGELMCSEAPGLWRGVIDREAGFVLLFHDRGAPEGACGVSQELPRRGRGRVDAVERLDRSRA